MTTHVLRAGAAWVALLIGSSVALAHHSFSMYDFRRTVTLKGTVGQFRWVNPHGVILIRVTEPSGAAPTVWNIELSSPGNLVRTGWSRQLLKVGDQVEVVVHPLRDGTAGGACVAVTFSSGRTLSCWAGDAVRAGEPTNRTQ